MRKNLNVTSTYISLDYGTRVSPQRVVGGKSISLLAHKHIFPNLVHQVRAIKKKLKSKICQIFEMSTDVIPPIPDRTDEQLKEIVRHPTHWRKDVLENAVMELYKRGYSVQELKYEKEKGAKQEWIEKQHVKKSNAKESYDWDDFDLFVFVFFWPLAFLIMRELRKEGYTRKLEQSYYCVTLGVVLWILVYARLR